MDDEKEAFSYKTIGAIGGVILFMVGAFGIVQEIENRVTLNEVNRISQKERMVLAVLVHRVDELEELEKRRYTCLMPSQDSADIWSWRAPSYAYAAR